MNHTHGTNDCNKAFLLFFFMYSCIQNIPAHPACAQSTNLWLARCFTSNFTDVRQHFPQWYSWVINQILWKSIFKITMEEFLSKHHFCLFFCVFVSFYHRLWWSMVGGFIGELQNKIFPRQWTYAKQCCLFFPFLQKVFQVLPSILVPEREHWLAPDLSILQGQQHK